MESEIAKWQTLLLQRAAITEDTLRYQSEMESAIEQSLNDLHRAELAKAKELESYFMREQALLAEIQRTEEVYRAVFSQLTDMELLDKALAQGRTSTMVWDLDGVDRKAILLWPQPAVLMAACAALGCILGILWAFVIETTREVSLQRAAGGS